MSGDQRGESGPAKVLSLDAFRTKARSSKSRRIGKICVLEDGQGDVDYQMEGVTALNALALLTPLLHLSARILEIYAGQP